jgi:hypothetical protein
MKNMWFIKISYITFTSAALPARRGKDFLKASAAIAQLLKSRKLEIEMQCLTSSPKKCLHQALGSPRFKPREVEDSL